MRRHKNPKNPLVSLVIPAYNEENFISKTLESVLDQDFKNFELIVVDNNSTDNTAKIAKKFGAKIIFEPNRGTGWARQAGLLVAKGEIIATTDADTTLPPCWLSRIVKEFEKDEDLVAFGGSADYYSGTLTLRVLVPLFLPFLHRLFRLIYGKWLFSGCNSAFKRKALIQVGGYDTSLRINEDLDVGEKLQKIGKVKFDSRFKVLTSGRRFRNGLILGLMDSYLPNFIDILILKKRRFNYLSNVRTEKPSWFFQSLNTLLISLLIVFILFLGISFYFFQSTSYAKEIEVLKIKLTKFEEKIEKLNIFFKN